MCIFWSKPLVLAFRLSQSWPQTVKRIRLLCAPIRGQINSSLCRHHLVLRGGLLATVHWLIVKRLPSDSQTFHSVSWSLANCLHVTYDARHTCYIAFFSHRCAMSAILLLQSLLSKLSSGTYTIKIGIKRVNYMVVIFLLKDLSCLFDDERTFGLLKTCSIIPKGLILQDAAWRGKQDFHTNTNNHTYRNCPVGCRCKCCLRSIT